MVLYEYHALAHHRPISSFYFNLVYIIYLSCLVPLDHCKIGGKIIILDRDPNAQCANNHAGISCGGCETNYSLRLAIGSFRCIVYVLYIAAVFLLVIFIFALNLTVIEGLINGLILYANTLWTFKDVLFPFEQTLTVNIFCTFIAGSIKIWYRDMPHSLSDCLLINMASVSTPSLHMVHCWSHCHCMSP